MFILGFITVAAIMVWLIITYLTFTRQENIETLVTSPISWLVYGFVFVIGSLASIGLFCWKGSQCKAPIRR